MAILILQSSVTPIFCIFILLHFNQCRSDVESIPFCQFQIQFHTILFDQKNVYYCYVIYTQQWYRRIDYLNGSLFKFDILKCLDDKVINLTSNLHINPEHQPYINSSMKPPPSLSLSLYIYIYIYIYIMIYLFIWAHQFIYCSYSFTVLIQYVWSRRYLVD